MNIAKPWIPPPRQKPEQHAAPRGGCLELNEHDPIGLRCKYDPPCVGKCSKSKLSRKQKILLATRRQPKEK